MGTPLNDSPQSCPSLVTCLGQVRNSSPPWFGGEGAASLRTPNCCRALGLLLLDWSLECSSTPLFLSGPDGRPCLSRGLLVLVRAGQINRTKCTKCTITVNHHTPHHYVSHQGLSPLRPLTLFFIFHVVFHRAFIHSSSIHDISTNPNFIYLAITDD